MQHLMMMCSTAFTHSRLSQSVSLSKKKMAHQAGARHVTWRYFIFPSFIFVRQRWQLVIIFDYHTLSQAEHDRTLLSSYNQKYQQFNGEELCLSALHQLDKTTHLRTNKWWRLQQKEEACLVMGHGGRASFLKLTKNIGVTVSLSLLVGNLVIMPPHLHPSTIFCHSFFLLQQNGILEQKLACLKIIIKGCPVW